MKYFGSGILVIALMLGLVGIAQACHRGRASAGGCSTQQPVQSYGCQGGTVAPPMPVQAVYGGCMGGAPVQQSYGCAGGTARVGLFHRNR